MSVIKNQNINYEDTCKIPMIEELITAPKNELEKAIIDVCNELAQTLIKKNRDYGDSYRKLKEEYGDMVLIFHETEKLERLKTLQKQGSLVNESKSDTKMDGAGYYILDEACERVMKK